MASQRCCWIIVVAPLLVAGATLRLSAQVVPLPVPDAVPSESVPGSELEVGATVADGPPAAQHRWFQPGYWLRPTPWDGGVELGINGTEGNSQTFNLRTGANVTRETEANKTILELIYLKASSDSTETAHNAFLKGRHEWLLAESPWAPYLGGTLQYDEFQAFDLRLAGHGGIGYRLIKTDASELTGRFGGGVSHEIGGPDDSYIPEAQYGMDLEYRLTARQKISGQVDYYPSWEDYTDYRIVSVVGWEILLDQETNLSLKITANDRYDSTPHGRRPNDLTYGVLLLWKL